MLVRVNVVAMVNKFVLVGKQDRSFSFEKGRDGHLQKARRSF